MGCQFVILPIGRSHVDLVYFDRAIFFMESLILAQDERWRRA
jgi:hypothetical protein